MAVLVLGHRHADAKYCFERSTKGSASGRGKEEESNSCVSTVNEAQVVELERLKAHAESQVSCARMLCRAVSCFEFILAIHYCAISCVTLALRLYIHCQVSSTLGILLKASTLVLLAFRATRRVVFVAK